MAWPISTEARGTATTERVLHVRPGDTLSGLMADAGIDAAEVAPAIAALAPIFPPRSLKPGQEIAIHLDPARDDALVRVEVEPVPGTSVRARLREGQWQVEEVVAPQHRMLARASGTVDGGLYPAAISAGLPPGLALSLIRTLGHEVDFQRDIQPGDRFSILFERIRGDDGGLLGHGRVLQVELTLSGRELAYWRHEARDGAVGWYDAQGRSLRRAFLRTPLDGARVSSGFGMRSHPVLGFTRLHAGIDFAAPTGTPVYAAADGTVVSARAEGAYGRIVRLRHAGRTETRYAHLSRFARGIAPGRRVRQGDVIGAVGSTGLSTGPHLHYEVVTAGSHVNPANQMTQNVQLAGRDLRALHAMRRALAAYATNLGARTEIAMAD
ncbi:M23 family metallopeptidase [Sabulicella glaciei]|uniref:Peptidoglycan DD-metalloendopeptidase family protein n=1 Tax=Sabulicella glaciei TaxID=2984948 RepID=A0ABT3P204_9PROT|nr:peptidoglycan DD-metalloendopeptidase family protein [Roseococcus sp. MDT2-1-1]MCW8088436.1 peptidoglycan DD-metalloendopeptidase family protein [Roseococcus sp. MDT2-1-1]